MAAFHFQVSMAATIHHSPRVSLHSVPKGSKGKPKLAFMARSDRLIFVTTPYATFSVSRNRHQWLSYAQSSSGLGEGAERPSGSENLILDEQSLEVELKNAIQDEDYAQAARLRDELRMLHENNQAGILAANARFYKAFEKGDLSAMGMIWSTGNNVHCIHPGAGCISGYDIVMESWELTFGPELDLPLQIELQNVEVYIKGNLGFITCLELVRTSGNNWGKQVATNIFEKGIGSVLLYRIDARYQILRCSPIYTSITLWLEPKYFIYGQYGNDYHENSSLSDNSASQLSSNLGKLGKENVVYDANIGTEITKVDMLEEFESDGTTKRKTVKETTTGEANSNDNEESQDEQQKSEVIAIAKNESNLENEEKSIVNKQNRISPNHHFKQPKPPKNGRSSENAFPRIINSRLQNQGTYPRTKSTTQSSKGTVLISKKGNEAQNDSAEIQSPASKGSLHRRVSIGTVKQNCTIPRPFSLATDKRASLGVRHSGGEIAGVESKRSIMNNAMSPLAERRQSATKSASAVSETKHLHHVGHKIPSTGASKGRPSSGTSASVSNNEGANNKKESNSELDEKVHAKEGRKHLQAKIKEQPEGQLEKVRKSQSFKATPMPNFYQAAAPPKPELKKIPPTRPKSPKLGRRNSSIGLDSDGNPSQSHISARLSLGHNNIERHLQKPRQDNASKTPSKAKSAVNMTMQSSSTTRRDKSVESKYNGSRIPVTPRKKASNIPETGYPSESIENDQIPTSKPVNDFSESSINEEKIMPQEADGVEENNAPKPKCVRDCFDSSTNEEKVTLQETDALE